MSDRELDVAILELAKSRAELIQERTDSDVILYTGDIRASYVRTFRDFIESIVLNKNRKPTITILLKTPGGDVETTERFVNIIRHHYKTVHFVVPETAMSAGTIWCMSGDKIYMDYASSLGPIDPQVMASDNSGDYIPAQGYLSQVEKLLAKNNLTVAELIMLGGVDLAKLELYEQAKEMSLSLLKTWLVKYKFKNWKTHSSKNGKKSKPVTEKEKEQRAIKIASMLSNNELWHSHGRNINITKIQDLKLKVEDYSNNNDDQKAFRQYHDPISSHADRMGFSLLLHSPFSGMRGMRSRGF